MSTNRRRCRESPRNLRQKFGPGGFRRKRWGIRDLDSYPQCFIQRQRAFRQPRGEGLPFQILHHEVIGAVLMADIVEHANVGVVEARDRLRLALETRFHLCVIGEMRRKDFDGDRAIQARIAGFVNLALPTRADGGKDFVRAEFRACSEDHGLAFQFKMSVMGETVPSSTARLTRNCWPSEDTAYCCLFALPSTGPPAMRTGNRAAGVPVSTDCPSGDNFTGTAIILLSSDT